MNILTAIEVLGEERLKQQSDLFIFQTLEESSPKDIKEFLKSTIDENLEQLVLISYPQIVKQVLK